jgi:ubiquinone/menaquinone biosynthesis C-methylase UbiE
MAADHSQHLEEPGVFMNIDKKLHLEQEWHESEDFARDANSLIVDVYSSSVFAEAEAYHLAALGDVSGRHVLDYGCGTGATAIQLLARGALVTGFDIAHSRLEEACTHVVDKKPSKPASFVQCAAERLPYCDESFDAVLGKQILHHLDLKIAIPEIARVLRPGGRAVFLEPLIHNPILEGYRRLTPHLRSPTERALSINDISWISSQFRECAHREFILLSIVPVLITSLTRSHRWLDSAERLLRKVDRAVADAVPAVGRYYWETVIVLER